MASTGLEPGHTSGTQPFPQEAAVYLQLLLRSLLLTLGSQEKQYIKG